MDELVKNFITEAEIEGFSADGGGVCRIGGRAVFVPRALPGERWRIRIVKVNRTAVWARGEQLLVPAPERIEPSCPAFGRCGGCAALHMDYACELRFKLQRVNDALRRIGGLSLQAEEILGAEQLEGYRNKAVYNFAPGPVCGFYRARSHDVIPVPDCRLLPADFDRTARALCDWMRENDVPAYDERTGSGLVRHLFLRRTEEGMTACIVAADTLPEGAAEYLCHACPALTGVLLCRNAKPTNAVLDGEISVLWGRAELFAALGSARFRLEPQTFFQINPAQTVRLYAKVREYADPAGKTVLDLYCGAGSIGLTAAPDAAKLLGCDIVPSAIDNARYNAALNHVSDAEYFCADAGQAAQMLADRGLRPDVIIVDPPRKGIDAAVIDAVCRMSPEKLVYVSCDPGTLARDLRLLTDRGWSPDRCTALDLFPRTQHCESVVSMSGGKHTKKR